MKTRSVVDFWPFILFALLIACRDIFYDLIFHEKFTPSQFAFSISITIVVCSFTILIVRKKLKSLSRKLLDPRVLYRSIILGVIAAIIYYVTFAMIINIGAGLFNLIDYGLAPILTALLGIIFFKEKKSPFLFVSFILYLVGLIIIYLDENTANELISGEIPINIMLLFLAAIISPIGTAISDFLTKWLLDKDKGNLDKEEILFIRFLPAALILFIIVIIAPEVVGKDAINEISSEMRMQDFFYLIIASVLLGFLPMYLLCIGLVRNSLSKYAVWEFLIPAIVFFYLFINEHGFVFKFEVFGALMILSGLILSQIEFSNSSK